MTHFWATRKPSSVLDDHLSRHIVANMLKRCIWQSEQLMCHFTLHQVGFAMTNLVTKVPVSSYLAFSTLPQSGGMFSVVLSLRSLSLAVSKHPVLWCPDFPRAFLPAIIWLTPLHYITKFLFVNNYIANCSSSLTESTSPSKFSGLYAHSGFFWS